MASSCAEQRQALLECLADSPCILGGRAIKDCVQVSNTNGGCKELNSALFECKRGQLDMRKRIKGNMPADYKGGPEPTPGDAAEKS